MNRSSITILAVMLAVASTNDSNAGVITFDVVVDQATVVEGGAVNWQIFATVSDISTDNFGISTIAVSLSDSLGDVLLPATSIGAPFSDYSFTSSGTFDTNTGTLLEISATLFTQNTAIAEGVAPNIKNDSNLGPLLLASGAFTPTTIGDHDLILSAGSANNFFTEQAQFVGNGRDFQTAFGSTSFSVSAVPEPSGALLWGLTLVLVGIRRHRNKSFGMSSDG